MNPKTTLQTTWLAMIAIQTIGSIDGQHRLPAPKVFIPIAFVWGVLFLLADTALAKVAAQLSVLTLLAATVLGPFGKRLVKLMDVISKNFAIKPTDATAAGADTGTGADAQAPSIQAV